jgi:membrane protein
VISTDTGAEQERGRGAGVPSRSQGCWWDVLLRLKDAIRQDRITLIAAGVAFYAMLALFPAMIVVVSIYGLVMDPEELATQVRALAVLPGDVRWILTGQLDTWPAPQRSAQPEPGLWVLVALLSASAGCGRW